MAPTIAVRDRPHGGGDRSAGGRRARVAAALRRHPEWPVTALVAAAWIALAAGAGGAHGVRDHGAAGHAAHGGAVLGALPGWTLMVVAMMVPLALPAVRQVALDSVRSRRRRAIALFLATYVAAWAIVGLAALGAVHLLAEAGAGERLLLAAALGVAAGWQLTRGKRRALFACAVTRALPPAGRRADVACVRAATLRARREIASCWALMLVMAVAGHANLLWMVALSAIVLGEAFTGAGARGLRASAGALAAAALAVAVA